jgi:hypothetical protein
MPLPTSNGGIYGKEIAMICERKKRKKIRSKQNTTRLSACGDRAVTCGISHLPFCFRKFASEGPHSRRDQIELVREDIQMVKSPTL